MSETLLGPTKAYPLHITNCLRCGIQVHCLMLRVEIPPQYNFHSIPLTLILAPPNQPYMVSELGFSDVLPSLV